MESTLWPLQRKPILVRKGHWSAPREGGGFVLGHRPHVEGIPGSL